MKGMKKCQACGGDIPRRKTQGIASYEIQKTCSLRCAYYFRIGKKIDAVPVSPPVDFNLMTQIVMSWGAK